MQPAYTFTGVNINAFDMTAPYNIIGTVGDICWAIAYVLMIRQNYKQKTYSLPMLAICMNISWEFLTSFVLPNPVPLWHTLQRLWFALDMVMVVQLFLYGRAEQIIPEIRRYFPTITLVTLLTCTIGLYTFVQQFVDRMAFMAAFIINLVMSALFVFFYFARRETQHGLSVSAAWLKMVGTLFTSLESHWMIPMIDPQFGSYSFLLFICVTIFVLDSLYIYLLSRKEAPALATSPDQLVAAPAPQ